VGAATGENKHSRFWRREKAKTGGVRSPEPGSPETERVLIRKRKKRKKWTNLNREEMGETIRREKHFSKKEART